MQYILTIFLQDFKFEFKYLNYYENYSNYSNN